MRRLAERVKTRLACQIRELYRTETVVEMATCAMGIAEEHIPVVISSTALFSTGCDGEMRAHLFDGGKNPRSKEEIERWTAVGLALAPQNPILKLDPATLARAVFRGSEIMSDAQLFESALYHEFFGPLGAYRQLTVTVPLPGGWGYIAAYRDGKDFCEQEVAAMEFMRPHIQNLARRHVADQERSEALMALEGGSKHTLQIVAIDADSLRIRRVSDYALTMLQSCGLTLRNQRLPHELLPWVSSQRSVIRWASGRTPENLYLQHTDGTVEVRIVENLAENEFYLLLLGKRGELMPARLQALGLTIRESEVLHWISEGKGSFEVATILGVARATIEKHTERLLSKLGVESKVAAVAEVRRWDCSQ